ncbi:hypothetical protein [Ichthyobacterium seriolicida]|uniref:Phage tail fiber protein n=1 Tax=Ichthyobacterium seriolicida TaxID=242600 RepID=A0A1J1DX52_9FLAO|nr:hypothetical protein [Ichthyobacterium seriolicida]BAV94434.1 phage tail fiber protein [Ichthyobacterium seriolicida]
MNTNLSLLFGLIFFLFLSIDSTSTNFPDKLSYQVIILKGNKLLKESMVSIRISLYTLNEKDLEEEVVF